MQRHSDRWVVTAEYPLREVVVEQTFSLGGFFTEVREWRETVSRVWRWRHRMTCPSPPQSGDFCLARLQRALEEHVMPAVEAKAAMLRRQGEGGGRGSSSKPKTA